MNVDDPSSFERRLGRRTLLYVVATALFPRGLRAEATQVPASAQAQLIAKAAAYDRNFAARAREKAKIVLLARPNEPESRLVATEMKNAFSAIATVGDRPHEEQIVLYTNAAALAETCKSRSIAIVYLGPGFADDIDAIRRALTSIDVLSVGGVADYVPNGIVLGFDLVSGKPKLLVNLSQARKQHVDFRADVLQLMRVYQ